MQILKAANILDLCRHADLDMLTLGAFALACDLELQTLSGDNCFHLTALQFLSIEYDLCEEGESEYSKALLDSVEAMLTDPDSAAFITKYVEARFGNN